MTGRRSKDPLTASATSLLLPALRPLGFKKKSARVIGRIRNEIFQLLDLQVSSFGSGDFCVNYASVALFCPREFLVLQPGSRLRNASGVEVWWPARSHDMANASMQEVVQALQGQAIPFFEATGTVAGLLDLLLSENWASRHHLEFELGCCLVRLGRIEEAERHLTQGISLYQSDGRKWCQDGIARSEELLGAIRRGVASELLQEWTRQSVRKLRLEEL